MRERNNPSVQTQIATCEEFSFKNAFADGNLHVTKTLMEGEGASVRKDLFAPFTECYKDAVFVIASNTLPASEAAGRETQFRQDVWQPLTTRVRFVYMTEQHSSDMEFPYSRIQLANALLWLAEHMHSLKEIRELDTEMVPDLCWEELLQWQKK